MTQIGLSFFLVPSCTTADTSHRFLVTHQVGHRCQGFLWIRELIEEAVHTMKETIKQKERPAWPTAQRWRLWGDRWGVRRRGPEKDSVVGQGQSLAKAALKSEYPELIAGHLDSTVLLFQAGFIGTILGRGSTENEPKQNQEKGSNCFPGGQMPKCSPSFGYEVSKMHPEEAQPLKELFGGLFCRVFQNAVPVRPEKLPEVWYSGCIQDKCKSHGSGARSSSLSESEKFRVRP